MKWQFYRKLNVPFWTILGMLAAFLIIATLYQNFAKQLLVLSNQQTDFYNSSQYVALRTQASQFVYGVLAMIVLAFLAFFLFGLLLRCRTNILEETLAQTAARYQIAFENLGDAFWEYDIQTGILKKSNADTGLCKGFTEIPDFRHYILSSGLLDAGGRETILHFFNAFLLHDTAPVRIQLHTNANKENEAWYELSANRVFDKNGIPVSVIGCTGNITEQKKLELKKKALEGQDRLTHLYNRKTIETLIDQYLDSIDNAGICAIFLIDLDDFSRVNKGLGTAFGDAAILELSARLKAMQSQRCRPQDMTGRVGGDCFLLFLTDVPSISYIEDYGRQLCATVRGICSGSSALPALTCSIGIAVFPSDGSSFLELCEKACLALREAKLLGKNRCLTYSKEFVYPTSSCLADYINDDSINFDNASSYEEHSLVDTNIVTNAIDILFDSQDNDDALQMLLSLIGAYYNLNRISIIQYSNDQKYISITQEWTSSPRYQLKNAFQEVPFSQDAYYARYRESKNGVFYSNAYLPELSEDMLLDPVPDRKPCQYFQCGFFEHGRYIGCISIAISNSAHYWSQNEIDSLTLISKIIGSYIVRQRSIHYADWLSKNDSLTGAFNFNTFLTEVNTLHFERPDLQLAMIYSDIRHFKLLNDNYGYQAGDAVLCDIADIYRAIFPDGILCRISGDKFALCTKFSDEDSLAAKAKLLISRCRQLSSSQEENYNLSIVLGIYILRAKDAAIIAVDRANIARKNAQRHNNSGYAFFTSTMRSSLILQKDLEDSMERSLQEQHFLLYFQPKFYIDTKMLCGAEALVRWQHPSLGFLYPNAFIPLFESNGFIVDLDYYIFEQVCIFLHDKLEKNIRLFPISVNFSREHFKADILPERLKSTVESYHIPPQYIEIEITESAFTVIDKHFTSLLDRIRSYGFRLAMDDFGSGLSSLSLLCDLPFNVLKIDKDFFHSKATTNRERIVISSTVQMAHQLDMEVICEGVETEEQADFLKSIGCNMAQGYLFSKPMSREGFVEKFLS